MAKKTPKTDEEKAAAQLQRAERKAERERVQRKEAEEVMARRRQQLQIANDGLDRIAESLENVRAHQKDRAALHDHATGFYEEVDKLAKGRALLEVTDLVVGEANQIIRDSKTLIKGDQYLDRVKEFVSAGNNPVYPDVVICLKTTLQALARAGAAFEMREGTIEGVQQEATIIQTALRLYCDEETYASKEDVKRETDADVEVTDAWFVRTDAGKHFDYDRLDETDLASYLTPNGE